MALDYRYADNIDTAIRHLLQARVPLTGDASAGDTSLTVVSSDIGLPGGHFFMDNTSDVTVVEPTSSNVPGGVSHSETATIDTSNTYVGSADGNIHLTGALSNAYTTGNGAYVRMTSVPSVCSDLEFIQNDFIPTLNLSPYEEWFPGVLVTFQGRQNEDGTSSEVYFLYRFRVHYCDLLYEDRNNSKVLLENTEELSTLIFEDNFLSGTVQRSNVVDVMPWHQTPIGQRYNFQSDNYFVGWCQFDIDCHLPVTWDKRVTA